MAPSYHFSGTPLPTHIVRPSDFL